MRSSTFVLEGWKRSTVFSSNTSIIIASFPPLGTGTRIPSVIPTVVQADMPFYSRMPVALLAERGPGDSYHLNAETFDGGIASNHS